MPSTKSPESDISPKTQEGPSPASPASKPADYFSVRPGAGIPTGRIALVSPGGERRPSEISSPTSCQSTVVSPDEQSESRRSSKNGSEPDDGSSRKSSVTSVSFRPPRNPSLPQGHQRKTDARRLREASPPAVRFKQHVAFDNLPVGEATKNNTSSYTLNCRHQGYHPGRRSRTFMVGVDEHPYSDYALLWMMDQLVDDGDEIVCVRVVESPVRAGEKVYQDDAKRMLRSIQEKNIHDRAISIVLEYSVGKLHATFQHLIQIYQPSMLIVGTRGRSLGGIQGLVNTRNSFSKYCLQYSPVPVVVVRPDEKRKKKADKRKNDPTRQNYVNMLARNEGKHEADSENSSLYEMEERLSPDEEAHKVAAALGLPAKFDPTLKPINPSTLMHPRLSASSLLAPSAVEQAAAAAPDSPARRPSAATASTANDSGDEESGDEDEDEFEAFPGEQALVSSQKKERLHEMEVGEAAALLKSGPGMGLDDDDEEEEEEGNSEETRS